MQYIINNRTSSLKLKIVAVQKEELFSSEEALIGLCITYSRPTFSLTDETETYSSRASVYYRCGRFSNTSSILSRIFAEKVNPINDVEKLNNIKKGYVGINGIFAENVAVTSKKDLWGRRENLVVLQGTLNGKTLTMFTKTHDLKFAEGLSGWNKAKALYVVGRYNKQGEIDVIQFGTAFSSLWDPDQFHGLFVGKPNGYFQLNYTKDEFLSLISWQ